MSHKIISPTSIKSFQNIIWEYYAKHRRQMPWRNPEPNGMYDPYKIMVSEIMLQQTQVQRVLPKYQEFLMFFPTVQYLAASDLAAVLKVWSGLGYNRRAKFLWAAAKDVVRLFDSLMPSSVEQLVRLPGIGPNTAAAIVAYAYDQPVVFVETNIRTVIIHHFFDQESNIADQVIRDIVEKSLPNANFRDWYYALMDYGSYLKATAGNKSRQAKVHAKQSTFHGSKRQIRGLILRCLAKSPLNLVDLSLKTNDERTATVCAELQKEGLIHLERKHYILG